MPKSKKKEIIPNTEKNLAKDDVKLLGEIHTIIEQNRERVAQTVNSSLVLMNWNIGKLINEEILKNKRAEYGKEILPTLSAKLQPEYGRGFSSRNLGKMIQFFRKFPNLEIVSTLSRQLSWSHFIEIIQFTKLS